MLSESQLRSGLPSSLPRKRGSCRNSAASRNLSSARACGSAIATASVRRSRERHRAETRRRKAISSPDGKRKNPSDLPGASRLPAPSFRRNGFGADLKSMRFTVWRRNRANRRSGRRALSRRIQRADAALRLRRCRNRVFAQPANAGVASKGSFGFMLSAPDALTKLKFAGISYRVSARSPQPNHGFRLFFGNRPSCAAHWPAPPLRSRLPLREPSAQQTAKGTLRRRCRQRRQATFALVERPP